MKERIEDKKKKLRKRRENISKAIAWASVLEDKPAETVKKPKIAESDWFYCKTFLFTAINFASHEQKNVLF